jgi:hypothetical protein
VKVAFVKQMYDVFGPWTTVLWNETTPRNLFDVWPGRGTFWEMACCLQADWYIIPQQFKGDYWRDAVGQIPGRAEVIERNTRNVVAPESIPFDRYDLVITFDPILNVPAAESSTLFAYFVVEHWDRLYGEALRQPHGRYDLFLAHILDAPAAVESLPQALAFPYLRDPDTMQAVFHPEKEAAVWVDFRTLTTLGMAETYGPWVSTGHGAAKRLEEVLRVPVRYKSNINENLYGISDPPAWGDAVLYFEQLARCRYYVAVGTIAGAGQALCDAASLGLICIGQQDKSYHQLICHPAALCESMIELPRRMRAIAGSRDLQLEALAWQEAALRDFFQRRPIEQLEKAISIKTKRLAAARQHA